MSFQHLESTRARGNFYTYGSNYALLRLSAARSGGQSKLQPKQRRDEESSFERSIKANVQQMQEATDQLDSAQRGYLSRRISESLDTALERSRELSQETEQLFRDWTVHLAGEPSERHRKKFSFEKLQRAFEQEVMHLKDVARRAVTTQQESGAVGGPPPLPEEALNSHKAGCSSAIECLPVCGDQAMLSFGMLLSS
ncbi:unnamed protein product [Prorocentrum cordatum]|uniref:V-type proton ATPase subunit a n=1 Tax=Prorocentrum cordatum TaxID=2364126 RepID=A0ABN9Q1G5_9DINO|nr:unnamed protein product [Polarella glacialis]